VNLNKLTVERIYINLTVLSVEMAKLKVYL